MELNRFRRISNNIYITYTISHIMSKTNAVDSEKNFDSIISDFLRDLTIVYPEYSAKWSKWQNADSEDLHTYCLTVYPERFFDILYSNADIFSATSTVNVNFLPNVDFKLLYNCEGISENTRSSIWKYLQLILFTVLGSVKNTEGFGKTTNLFEAIDEAELQQKMAETMASLGEFFNNASSSTEGESESEAPELVDPTDDSDGKGFKMPDLEKLHEHMKGLLEGKIGKLAKEFTDEFMEEMTEFFGDIKTNSATTSKDIIMQLMKNPQKMVIIFKKLAAKLQDKMKNGEISQEELMQELGGIMEKMQGMGVGKGDMADLLKSMKDMPFMKMFEKTMGGGKIDMNAVNRMTQQNATKERLRKKMEQRQAQAQAVAQSQAQAVAQAQTKTTIETAGANHYVVHIGDEKQEKSGLRPPTSVQQMTDDELVKYINSTSGKAKAKGKGKK